MLMITINWNTSKINKNQYIYCIAEK